jgi:tetratricopeptide (TPR) repeat protein
MVLLVLSLMMAGCAWFERTGQSADESDTARRITEASDLAVRRQFAGAETIYDAILSRQPDHIEALRGKALAYYQNHEWEKSAEAWKKVLAQQPDDREAAVYRWDSMMKTAGEDSVARGTRAAKLVEEAREYLEGDEGDSELNLSMAYYCLSLAEADSTVLEPVQTKLLENFPDSRTTYEIAGNIFYDNLYPIWRNDRKKVEFLSEFVDRYTEQNWRRTAYQALFHSLVQLGRLDTMKEMSRRWIDDAPEDPWAYNTISYWYLDQDLDLTFAKECALKAMTLQETFPKPANYPPQQWKMNSKILYGSARMNLARALVEAGNLQEAESTIRDAIENTGFGVDDERTVGSYYFILGQIEEKRGNMQSAMDAFLEALVRGDSRNQWTPKADSCFAELCAIRYGGDANVMDIARERKRYSDVVFDDVTETSGLGDVHGSRVAWGDYNNDGWEDLLVNGCRLFENKNGGGFVEVTAESGISGNGNGGIWGDYDNDRYLDMFMISGTTDALWKNLGPDSEGRFRFREVTEEAGKVSNHVATEGAGWADADNDGYLDLYCANYEVWRETSSKPEGDQFFLNNGDGTFEECLSEAGMTPPFDDKKAGRGVNWGDFDDDGDQDCFVSNYRLQENFLWENDGKAHFRNNACSRGVAGTEVEGWWGHTIGSEWGDYDNDGDLDLITANLAHPRYIEFSDMTKLYENLGPPDYRFEDRRAIAGIRFEETHSDPSWGDVDKDGYLDLYLTSVYSGRRSFLYLNNGNGTFREVTWLAGVRHFNGWGCAFCDFDRDGDLDLAVAGGSLQLLENRGNSRHWLQVKVAGSESNRTGIGSRLILRRGDEVQIREVQGGKGTTNQHSMTQFFGLSGDPAPAHLTVRFPSGRTQTLSKVAPDQILTVFEQ